MPTVVVVNAHGACALEERRAPLPSEAVVDVHGGVVALARRAVVDEADVHPFAFPAPWNRYLLPADVVFAKRDGSNLSATDLLLTLSAPTAQRAAAPVLVPVEAVADEAAEEVEEVEEGREEESEEEALDGSDATTSEDEEEEEEEDKAEEEALPLT